MNKLRFSPNLLSAIHSMIFPKKKKKNNRKTTENPLANTIAYFQSPKNIRGVLAFIEYSRQTFDTIRNVKHVHCTMFH